jgi:ABC-type phosphate transport system substrate-binding protein
MSSFSARRVVAACIVSAAAAAALVAPGAANAFSITQCQGVSIEGFGSSLQSIAQKEVWGPDFNTSSLGCTAVGAPTVKYTSASSGEALEAWGVNGHATNYGVERAFTGTDQPANPTQMEEIEKNATGGLSVGKGTLRTIPVLQAAVAVIVHLPEGCTATSTAAPGRLALKAKTLEKIFQGTDKEWSKIKSSEGGDTFTGCPKKGAHITRVVRAEGSGTTAIFKKFLHLADKGDVEGSDTWEELAEAVPNTTWPNEGTDAVVRGVKGSGVVAEVAATPGSIGYVNLAEARVASMTPPAGGPGKSDFWVEIENNKTGPTYADPSTDGDEEAKAEANCAETTYTNGKKKFPPPLTSSNWNEVTSSLTEKNYPICAFTYDQVFSHYGDYEGTSEGEARTVFDYLNFALSAEAEGGQTLLANNHDYLGLPTSANPSQNVLKIAQEGAAEINE